ncbi:MAG: hypothetical protein R3A47_11715 [Polyangiales bacterium]
MFDKDADDSFGPGWNIGLSPGWLVFVTPRLAPFMEIGWIRTQAYFNPQGYDLDGVLQQAAVRFGLAITL